MFNASLSLLSSRASSNILSMPRSLSAPCLKSDPNSFWNIKKIWLTAKHCLYSLKSDEHSSVVALPLRYSSEGQQDQPQVKGEYHTLAVPFQEARIITPKAKLSAHQVRLSGLHTHSLTSLHSGANDADIFLFSHWIFVQNYFSSTLDNGFRNIILPSSGKAKLLTL